MGELAVEFNELLVATLTIQRQLAYMLEQASLALRGPADYRLEVAEELEHQARALRDSTARLEEVRNAEG